MKFFAALFIFTLYSGITLAQPDHGGPPRVANCASACKESDIREAIARILPMIARSGELNSTWETAQIQSLEVKTDGRLDYWVMNLLNLQEQHPAKKNLYLTITSDGFLAGYDFREPNLQQKSKAYMIAMGAVVITVMLIFGFLAYFLIFRKSPKKE